jgi:hypothetical protein
MILTQSHCAIVVFVMREAAIRSTKLAQALLSFPRDRPCSPCSMQSSKTTGKMFSLVIERSLSLWESNICEARAPFPSLQDWWRERSTAQLPGITVFDVSIANNERFMRGLGAFNLFNIFPNLKELDMSNYMLVGSQWPLQSKVSVH